MKSEKGFTLVELIVAMVGLGLLLSATFPDQKGQYTEAVYAFDKKLDDGNGATGNIRTMYEVMTYGADEDYCADANGVYRLNETEATICNFAYKY